MSAACPACGDPVTRSTANTHIRPRYCARGHGLLLTPEEVGLLVDEAPARALGHALRDAADAGPACPDCGGATREVRIAYTVPPLVPGADAGPAVLPVSGCTVCGSVWCDTTGLKWRGLDTPPSLSAAHDAPPTPDPSGVLHLAAETVWVTVCVDGL